MSALTIVLNVSLSIALSTMPGAYPVNTQANSTVDLSVLQTGETSP
ncbi:hypothetical protein ACFQEX_08135 [Roseibium salinum]